VRVMVRLEGEVFILPSSRKAGSWPERMIGKKMGRRVNEGSFLRVVTTILENVLALSGRNSPLS
jgi:hypothetical protein